MIVFVERDMCVLSSVRKLEAEVVKSKREQETSNSPQYTNIWPSPTGIGGIKN